MLVESSPHNRNIRFRVGVGLDAQRALLSDPIIRPNTLAKQVCNAGDRLKVRVTMCRHLNDFPVEQEHTLATKPAFFRKSIKLLKRPAARR